MIVPVTVIGTTPKGVQVVTGSTDAPPFWLPRTHPAVVWSRAPEPGETVTVRVPAWLVDKHGQLRELRHQCSLSFHQPPPGLGPGASREGSLPMAYDNEKTGALFKNRKKEKPSHPDYRGQCEIGGRKLWISAWLKKSEKSGETYMSLSFTEAEEQRQQPAQSQHQERDYSHDIPF